MGSFLSVQSLQQALPIFQQGFGLATNIAQTFSSFNQEGNEQDLALIDLQNRQNAGIQDLEERAALERSEIAENAQQADRRRRAALKRSVSRQRAAFGSSGIASGSGGSSEAVLLGLFDESDNQREERERLDALRFGAIDQNIANQRRLNLIQRTQLQQRQDIGRLSSNIGRIGDISNLGFDALQFANNLR